MLATDVLKTLHLFEYVRVWMFFAYVHDSVSGMRVLICCQGYTLCFI